MEEIKAWKKNLNRISQLEKDLTSFRKLWNKSEKDSTLIRERTYLEAISKSILTLDRHAEELSEEKILGESASLIHYILQTPWGAPFVGKSTLLEAAKTYPDEESLNSSLCKTLAQFEKFRHRGDLPLMKNLDQIQREIKKARKLAA